MVHRLILTSFGILTLTTCQNSKVSESTRQADPVKTVTKADAPIPKSASVTTAQTSAETKPNTTATAEKPLQQKAANESVKTPVKEQQNLPAQTAGVIYLKEGENKYLKEYEMNVTFKKMTEDSRCPKDADCIWAGVATAEVEFMGVYTRPVTLMLSTMTDAKKGYSKSDNFNGYTISLVEVAPQTTSAKGFKALQGSYRIGLKFTKGKTGDPTTQRTGATTR